VQITVRPLREEDLPEADRTFRLAFGTFIGLPDPLTFAGDSDWIATRWRADASAAFAAEVDGRLVGSNFATNWGSVGFFGPLSVHPDLWNQGVARRLLEPTMRCFTRWGTRHAGLFTFAQSAKHVHLYQRFGFYARFLTAVMVRPATPPAENPRCTRFSAVPVHERTHCLAAARELTGEIFDGLDLTREIRATAAQRLGDTLFVWRDALLVGVAVCHHGPGSEAGGGTCYAKFAAARSGGDAGGNFERLLDALDAFGAEHGAQIAAGVNLGREDAYRRLMARGFRTVIQGVAMHRPNEDAYDRRDAYVLDDWR
jgi:GNAT superfamily N-acetyltransferase